MKFTRIFVTFICFISISLAHAQYANDRMGRRVKASSTNTAPWKGLRLSYDRSILKYSSEADDLKQGFNGLSAGYVQSFGFGSHLPLFFETGAGLSFSHHSFETSNDEVKSKVSHNLLGLYIPANIVYQIDITNGVSLKPYTGIYLRLGIIGKEKYEFEIGDISVSDSYSVYGEDGCDWRRFQIGWQVGATLDFGTFNIGVGYGLDLNKIAPEARFGTFSVITGINF